MFCDLKEVVSVEYVAQFVHFFIIFIDVIILSSRCSVGITAPLPALLVSNKKDYANLQSHLCLLPSLVLYKCPSPPTDSSHLTSCSIPSPGRRRGPKNFFHTFETKSKSTSQNGKVHFCCCCSYRLFYCR